MNKHKVVAFILTLCMVMTMFPTASFAATPAAAADRKTNQTFVDMTGHWAEAAVSKWAGLGIVKGDAGGFRPNDLITRAELAVILDNLMDYQTKSDQTFSDVKSNAWYADAILKANAAGILHGDGAGSALPSAKVTREQAAVMLGRAFGVDENTGNQTAFNDASNISKWAKQLVFGMEAEQYIGGMGNGNFEPKTNITRAQVVTMIDNAVKAYYTEAGTYTENVSSGADSVNCVAIVRTSGVTLKGLKISGDLIVAEGVGNGDFTLDGATVTGKLIARGGGENSIHVINGADVKGKVSIQKIDGVVRIVSDGVVIADLEADAQVILEGEFTNVVVAEGASVEVRGQITNLEITAKAEIKLTKDAKVGTIAVAKEAEGTNLNIDKAAELQTLKTEAKMTTSGDGAAKTVTGTGTVTDKETGKTEGDGKQSSGGGGSGSGGNPGGTADKRSVSFEDNDNDTTMVTGNTWGINAYFIGTDSSGNTCDPFNMASTIAVKNKDDGMILNPSLHYSVSEVGGRINLLSAYIGTLSEGKHILEFSFTASDGKVFALDYSIYIIPTTAVILYDQPEYGSLSIYEYSGTKGDLITSGGSMSISDEAMIELTDLPADQRIKSVLITESYYGYARTFDKTKDFIEDGGITYYSPKGTVTIQVVTEEVPSSLPEIAGIEFYLNYDKETDTYSDKVTDTVPARVPDDSALLYAKILDADGTACKFANYHWQVATGGGIYTDIPGYTDQTTYDHIWCYHVVKDSGRNIQLTASGYEKQSHGTVSAIIYVEKPLENQAAPTGLTASAVSSATATDGKIGNTTTAMEYSMGLTETEDGSDFITCTEGETTGLGVGTYYVRYKAKP